MLDGYFECTIIEAVADYERGIASLQSLLCKAIAIDEELPPHTLTIQDENTVLAKLRRSQTITEHEAGTEISRITMLWCMKQMNFREYIARLRLIAEAFSR